MDNPQLVDYIRSQMAAGHTEATVREHLIKHGWSSDKVDSAFAHYNRSHVISEPARSVAADAVRPPRRGGRDAIRRHRTKLGKVLLLLVVVALAVGSFLLFKHEKAKPTIPVVHEPTLQQKQSLDVVTIGGAVGQYVATNSKTLPTHVSPAPDGSDSVVLCGAVCDPSTWQVSSLSAYKPTGVRMVPYTLGLTVSDPNTLLLVSGARCNEQGTELSTKDVKALSMSILYASEDGGSLKQRCVIL